MNAELAQMSNPIESDEAKAARLAAEGEQLQAHWQIQWFDAGRIEKGEWIAPARIRTDAAERFSALHLALSDLAFALDCLNEADKLGLPNVNSTQSKALIFSGVVAYARAFKSSVRKIQLETHDLVAAGAPFDNELHEYLMALRNKHIAHSVNDFESCQAAAIVVGRPGSGWRAGSGIGFTKTSSIGLPRRLLRAAVKHIDGLQQHLSQRFEAEKIALNNEFNAEFARDGKWEMAPFVHFPDRAKISRRRP